MAQAAGKDEIPAFAKKYPDGLLTGDHGIVTEEDLAFEAWQGNERPFNPNEDSGGYNRWQCFPVKNVKPKVRTWRDSDPMGRSDVIVTMCDLETWVDYQGQAQVYYGRRAKEVTYCNDYVKNWKKLTRGQAIVCLSGEYDGIRQPDKNSPPVPYRGWTWDKVKTKKGCYSYFDGDCDPEHWKQQGYPKPKR